MVGGLEAFREVIKRQRSIGALGPIIFILVVATAGVAASFFYRQSLSGPLSENLSNHYVSELVIFALIALVTLAATLAVNSGAVRLPILAGSTKRLERQRQIIAVSDFAGKLLLDDSVSQRRGGMLVAAADGRTWRSVVLVKEIQERPFSAGAQIRGMRDGTLGRQWRAGIVLRQASSQTELVSFHIDFLNMVVGYVGVGNRTLYLPSLFDYDNKWVLVTVFLTASKQPADYDVYGTLDEIVYYIGRIPRVRMEVDFASWSDDARNHVVHFRDLSIDPKPR